jgi:hypothetical protein
LLRLRPPQRILGRGGGVILHVLESEQLDNAVGRECRDLLQGIGLTVRKTRARITEESTFYCFIDRFSFFSMLATLL